MNVLVIAAVSLTHWAVPPLSDEMRLPDTEPSDGEKGGVVRIVAARDEYEPGSFVVRADADLADVTLSVSELKTDQGEVFPAEDVDLRVVKVWYQNLNGWYSYYEAYGKRIAPTMSDEEALTLSREILPTLVNLKYVVAEKRARYLREKLTE